VFETLSHAIDRFIHWRSGRGLEPDGQGLMRDVLHVLDGFIFVLEETTYVF
jgi:hypothetical protein